MSLWRSKKLKRLIDLMGAIFGLSILWPLLGLIALGAYVAQGRPILFTQKRPGLRGMPFTIYKFRTMATPVSDDNWLRTDKQRLTLYGWIIRKLSLDELPSLWNVLKGDMSLVGPRPLLREYLRLYSPAQMKRHDVSPGITGLVQVAGRQSLKFSERFDLDLYYIDHWSNWLDMVILAKTLIQLFSPKGAIPGQNIDDIDDLGFLSGDSENRSLSLEGP